MNHAFLGLYALLLRVLLPPGFHREWAGPMRHEAALQLEEARGAGRSVRGRLLVDALRTGWAEWRAVASAAAELGRGEGSMGVDVKVALRGLRRSPGYTAAVTATLALGIAAVGLVFSLVDAYLLRALPYPDADRLVVLWSETNWSRAMLADARRELDALGSVSGFGGELLVLEEGGEPLEIVAGWATAGHLQELGARAALGRLLLPSDGEPGAEPVTVLAHDLWMDRFGGDPEVVGRAIALGGEGEARRTVVGVLPPDFSSLLGRGAEAWIPVTMDPALEVWAGSQFLTAVGRLREGVEVEAARAAMRAWAAAYREANPGWFSEDEVRGASLRRLRDEVGRETRTPLLLSLAAAGLVLLVACANVANLVLARTTARRAELSVRAALGSGRARAAGSVLAEAVLLGVAGGTLGLLLVSGAGRLVELRVPDLVSRGGLAVSPRVLAFSAAVTSLAVLLAGVLPALRVAARAPGASLAAGRGTSADRGLLRLQGGLAGAQLALALVGVASAGLLGRSLVRLAGADPGFTPDGVTTFRLSAPPGTYADGPELLAFHLEVRDALARVPGVESVGMVSRLPMGRGQSRTTVVPEGVELPATGELPEVTHRLVASGYLETLGARVVEGALPGPDEDRAEGPLRGVINRAAAERFWPGESAVGRRFLGRGGVVWLEVAAVVDDLRELGVTRAREEPAVYIPLRDWPWRTMYAAVRTRGPADVPSLKAAVWSVAGGVPVNDVRALATLVEDAVRPTRLLTLLAGAVGVLTLLLGAVGVYGVVSWATSQRGREHGVRAALGAAPAQLTRAELRRAGRTILLGAAAGTVGAWVAGRALAAAVPGVGNTDPGVVAGAALLLLAVGLLAAWIPARRSARIDPVEALRPG